MDQSLFVPLGILAAIGAVASHLLANARVRRAQREFAHHHMKSITQLADAAIEVMAVEYGAKLDDAMKKLLAAAQQRNPFFVGLAPQSLAGAEAHIEKLRSEKQTREKASGDDTKPVS